MNTSRAMPVSRYRLIRPLPPYLEYPSARFALEIVRQRHATIPADEWVFRARKLNADSCVIASALAMRSRLEQLLIDGIDVPDDTPASRIMARLVRDGVAEKLRPMRR
jgi:hypothetical protein